MSEPFLAEVKIFGFNFAPRGWAKCDGQILPINQNQSLYSLLGTTYGGDGRTSFGLPDLRGRTPIHKSSSHPLGQKGGEEMHSLNVTEMPAHGHTMPALNVAGEDSETEEQLPATGESNAYRPASGLTPVAMGADTIGNAGGGQGHNNMQPLTVLNFCIALQGLFPSRN